MTTASPFRVAQGASPVAHVKAGEVIDLVGDSGNGYPGRHLSFALSVRPSSTLPEVYWDPAPLMASWPLRVPALGTVAGFVPQARTDPRHLRAGGDSGDVAGIGWDVRAS